MMMIIYLWGHTGVYQRLLYLNHFTIQSLAAFTGIDPPLLDNTLKLFSGQLKNSMMFNTYPRYVIIK